MTGVTLLGWAAWAPNLEDEAAWRAWCEAPAPIPSVGAPDVGFLPLMLRRRCDLLSRMMLEVTQRCVESTHVDRAKLASVFASRHGSFATAISLLEDVARGEATSPARFSHSVHNAQAGLFSIWALNRHASTALAAGPETFVAGFLESLAMLQREPLPVLFVVGDEAIPEAVRSISDHAPPPHALALLLADQGEGGRLNLRLDASGPSETRADTWPNALAFLRWWLSSEPRLELVHSPRRWIFERG